MTFDERTSGRLENSVRRAQLLLSGAKASSSFEAAEAGAGVRGGPPDEQDRLHIAARIRAARGDQPPVVAGQNLDDAADALAAQIVTRARDLLAALKDGGSDGAVGDDDAAAFEAVIQVRGRPALRVEGRLEPIDDDKHPGSGFWRPFFTQHEMRLIEVASATGAVVVKDRAGGPARVQGTAWLVAPGLVLTNRHVVFPPMGGVALASRTSGSPTTARLKTNLEVTLDFAHDHGTPRNMVYVVEEVPFVAEAADPVDVAVLRIRPTPALGAAEPKHLALADQELAGSHLYVIGHPGPVAHVPENIMAVFGKPDERKRVSFGAVMKSDPPLPREMLHDASTIGGYSGGCVLAFGSAGVAGLHYYGHPLEGNRAFTAATLRAHEVAGFL